MAGQATQRRATQNRACVLRARRTRGHAFGCPGERARAGFLAGCAVLLALLVGCAPNESDRTATGVYRLLNSPRNPTAERLESESEFALATPSRALVHVPEALLMVERRLGSAIEQRLLLPNRTALRGDNVLVVRAQSHETAQATRFNLEELTARLGAPLDPFERANFNAAERRTDALGSFVYLSERIGTDTICVLALRRVGGHARLLPRGAHSLDVVLRNCVAGSVDEALAPISAEALATAAAPSGRVLSASPFAAPLSPN